MRKHTEIELKYYIYIQSKALKNVLIDSRWFAFQILLFNAFLFSLIGRDGFHSWILWVICFLCIINLFQNAMNAAEVGL